jgi:hypothetical protein
MWTEAGKHINEDASITYRNKAARVRIIASVLGGLRFALFAICATCQAQTTSSTTLAANDKELKQERPARIVVMPIGEYLVQARHD